MLLFVAALLLLSTPIVWWWTQAASPWYTPYLIWGGLIAATAFITHKRIDPNDEP